MKYVLASGSERRQELLHRIVDEFDIIVSDFDESKVLFKDNIDNYVINLAKGKSLSVKESLREDSIIIAGDTIVVLENKILG
ncbi:septum formation inhibitor Maf, partial [Clostridium perfringens]|nr:septum formation inhibitor Maf [Clostridium perfringens]